MDVWKLLLLLSVVFQVMLEKSLTDVVIAKSNSRAVLPTLENIGKLTKWISEPPKRSPWKVIHSMKQGVMADPGTGTQLDGKYVDFMRFEDKVSKLAHSPNLDLVRDQN